MIEKCVERIAIPEAPAPANACPTPAPSNACPTPATGPGAGAAKENTQPVKAKSMIPSRLVQPKKVLPVVDPE